MVNLNETKDDLVASSSTLASGMDEQEDEEYHGLMEENTISTTTTREANELDFANISTTTSNDLASENKSPLMIDLPCYENEEVGQTPPPPPTTPTLQMNISNDDIQTNNGGGVKRKSEGPCMIDSINERTSRLGLQAESSPSSSFNSSNNSSNSNLTTATTTITTPHPPPTSLSATREKRIRKQKAFDDDFLMFSPLPSWQASHNLSRADSNGNTLKLSLFSFKILNNIIFFS